MRRRHVCLTGKAAQVTSASVQIYGYQSMKEGSASEQILGRVAKSSGQKLVLGTKFFTVRLTPLLHGAGVFNLHTSSMYITYTILLIVPETLSLCRYPGRMFSLGEVTSISM